MARHPGTEGNELHPSDVIIPDPSGGDGRLSVRNDLAAEFAGLAISSTQPSDMPNGGVWVNLSAEPTGIDRLQTYDESTDAFIPISADSTVVSEEEPEPEIGLLWFEPVDDGANLYAANSDTWEFLQFIPAIPNDGIEHDYNPLVLTGFDDGDTVTEDPDRTGNNDLSGEGEYRVSGINGNASLYVGSGEDYTGDPQNHSQSYTLHWIISPDSGTDDALVGSTGEEDAGPSGTRLRRLSGQHSISHSGEDSTSDFDAGTDPKLISVRRSSSDGIEIRKNGSDTIVDEDINDLNDPDGRSIFGGGSDGDWEGHLGRRLTYSIRQSDDNFDQTISALLDQYDI